MIRFFQVAVLVLATVRVSGAAFEFRPVSAASGGCADAPGPMMTGAEALFANPAGLALGAGFDALLLADRRFGLAEVATHGAGIAFAGRSKGIGAGFTRFGLDAFREETLMTSVAYRFRHRLAVGTRVRLLRLSGAGFDARSWTAVDLGFQASAGTVVHIGATAWNVTGVPAVGRGGSAGLGARLSDRATLYARARKDADRPVRMAAGVSLVLEDRLVVRAGVSTHPHTLSAGAGVQVGGLVIDYAASDHPSLGISHRASVRFEFNSPSRGRRDGVRTHGDARRLDSVRAGGLSSIRSFRTRRRTAGLILDWIR